MGISSSKSKTVNKPVYSSQIEGAGNSLTSSYNSAMPKIQAMSDSVSSLVPGMVDKYKAGGSSDLVAARDYNTQVLGGKYLDQGNPYLEQMVATTGNNVTNSLGAKLAKMGLGPAGSTYQGAVGRQLAESELGLRYSDYNSERERMATAAGQVPSLTAADGAQLQAIMEASDAASNPLRASVGYASGLGGLLGQYQDTTTKTSNPWGMALLQGLGSAAAAYAGG